MVRAPLSVCSLEVARLDARALKFGARARVRALARDRELQSVVRMKEGSALARLAPLESTMREGFEATPTPPGRFQNLPGKTRTDKTLPDFPACPAPFDLDSHIYSIIRTSKLLTPTGIRIAA